MAKHEVGGLRKAGTVRPHDLRRGNDLLFKPRGEADAFDHYLGPFGSDMRMSIEGSTVNNRDTHGDTSKQKLGHGPQGAKRTRSTRKDESDY